MKNNVKIITKTDYIRYLECPRCAWLFINRPDLCEEDEAVNVLQGMEAEKLAHGLFGKGVEVAGNYADGAKETSEYLKNGETVIFQPQPMTEEFLARGDVLVKTEIGYDLYEIKSATSIKPEHISDLKFQANVFRLAGIHIQQYFLVHINSGYVFSKKEGLDIKKLFVTENVTENVTDGLRAELNEMRRAHKILTSSKEPDFCGIKRNFRNPLPDKMENYYREGIPDYSIYDISGINPGKIKALEANGIKTICEVPDNFPLTEKQMAQVRLTKDKAVEISKERIKSELDKLEFPLWFFDYETIQLAIPRFDGTVPWQQIPMQYSLHRMDKNGRIKHYSYLYRGWRHPFIALAKKLKWHMGKKGTVISWNASFEKERNKEVAAYLPKYSEFFLGVNSRMYDLMGIFKDMYKDYRFKGGTSLKTVLPVLVPELSYAVLDIQGGGEASSALYHLVKGETEKPRAVRSHLQKYCELDTLAMVRIYEFLKKLI